MPIPMNTLCHRCLLQKHTDTALTMTDPDGAAAFSRALLKLLAEAPEDADSSVIGPDVQALFQKHLGFLPEDSYREEKQQSNRFALEKLPQLRQRIAAAEDPVYRAMQLAVLGNYIDFSALGRSVSLDYLDTLLQTAHTIDLDKTVYARLYRELSQAKTFLLLCDNAGEVIFDIQLAETLHSAFPQLQITLCVRGKPIHNDATREDLEGIRVPFPLIDSGCAIGGTPLHLVTPVCRQAVESADVVLAKGMGNTETLYGCGLNIYYLFLVKCPRFMQYFGKEKMTPMLLRDPGELKINQEETL